MSLDRPKQLQRTDKASPSTVCQKCTKRGHYTYQCTNSRPYVPRLSRTQRLEKDLKIGDSKRAGDGPLVELPDEFRSKKGLADKILEKREAQRKLDEQKKKSKSRKRRSSSSSSSGSGSESDSDSDSDSGSDSNSDSDSSSSRSNSPPPRRRRDKRGDSRSVSPAKRTKGSRDAAGDRRRSRSPARKDDRRDRSGSP